MSPTLPDAEFANRLDPGRLTRFPKTTAAKWLSTIAGAISFTPQQWHRLYYALVWPNSGHSRQVDQRLSNYAS